MEAVGWEDVSDFDKVVKIMVRASDTSYERMANGIEALRAAGWAVVPRETTEEIMKKGDEAIREDLQKAQMGISYGLHPEHACWNVYRDMLAAGEVRDE